MTLVGDCQRVRRDEPCWYPYPSETVEEERVNRYLFTGQYASEAVKGIASKGGSARVAAIEKMAADMGGRLVSFDFALGEDDFYIIVEVPDIKTATATSLAVNATGLVRVRTVPLMTAQDVDEASKMAVNYSPPGQ